MMVIMVMIIMMMMVMMMMVVMVMMILILMLSEMVERGGYTSLDLLDGDCVLRPQVIQYHRKQPSLDEKTQIFRIPLLLDSLGHQAHQALR